MFFAEREIEPEDIALLIPAGLFCYMRHAFQLMCEVVYSHSAYANLIYYISSVKAHSFWYLIG